MIHARHWLEEECVKHQSMIKAGEPIYEVCKYAEKEEFDLTLIGNRERRMIDGVRIIQSSWLL
ncbi:hypothetical protein BEP19_10260 [Ammoniphilus oxalaticus]|uniref:Uncharacterized protein n=1 Tax=Ammoniphilus oxalaticus TaxID=66863 RepID=A0A419SFU4_9BACL|nr:hypothetical protein [Ammoniphilus oxalaticus]RKD22635.1 hypothetical protein BEP19_10260 [Ammoniphilus oxalaticus]